MVHSGAQTIDKDRLGSEVEEVNKRAAKIDAKGK